MSRFLLGISNYGVDPHTPCFLDVVKAMAGALRALGHEVEYAGRGKEGRLIIFGANGLADDPDKPGVDGPIPADAIVFNSEQVSAVKEPTFFLQHWLKRRNFTVWDYAESNVASLRQLGIERSVLCPIGYVPSMTTIEPAPEEDIDVLFYGSVAGSRRDVLDALDGTGLNVVRLFGVYGAERDAYIARAKVVLNLHFYPNGVFEIFRVSHLLANKKCVVTEAGGRDKTLEALAARTCAYVPRDELVERCRELAASPHRRATIAEQGHEEFKKIDFVQSVKIALEAS